MASNSVVNVTDFKAKCLSIFDDVVGSQKSLTVTRRGKPLVVVSPATKKGLKYPMDSWATRGKIVGDIVNTDRSHLWEALDVDEHKDRP